MRFRGEAEIITEWLPKVCFHELNPVQVRVKITAEVRDAAAFGAGPAGSPEEEVVDQQEKMVVHVAAHRREDRAVTTVLARRNALQNIRGVANRFVSVDEAETQLRQADEELKNAATAVNSTDETLAFCIQGHH